MLNLEQIVSLLQHFAPAAKITLTKPPAGEAYLSIPAENIAAIATYLKDTPELAFDSLMNLSGVDYPPDSVAVVYHLFSYTHRHRLTLEVRVSREGGIVPSISSVWKLANWMEREVFDLLGISFANHPDLRRLLLPQDWVGHPLRKDYKEQPEYQGIPTERKTKIGSAR